ncbi:MAG: HEPN domain-containing protein [Candidatus Woesearchaeota archaeon]
MIHETRLKQAKNNFINYYAEGLIKKEEDYVAKKFFIKNANESIRAAQLLFENKNFLWTIVCSYYSMFYIANAALLELGYKVKDKIVHKVTADALMVLVRPKLKDELLKDYEEVKDEALEIAKLKSDEIIHNFDYERTKRNKVQYQTTELDITKKSKTSLKRAKEFLFELEKLF